MRFFIATVAAFGGASTGTLGVLKLAGHTSYSWLLVLLPLLSSVTALTALIYLTSVASDLGNHLSSLLSPLRRRPNHVHDLAEADTDPFDSNTWWDIHHHRRHTPIP